MTPEEFTNAVRPRVLANKNFNKIFCIGYNKTGTTTLDLLLRFYGYSLPSQKEQETLLTQQVFATDYTAFVSFVTQFDAFQDLPFSQDLTYVAADALFPNSKFILTERNSDQWFDSMTKFVAKLFNIDDMSKITEQDIKEKFTYLYPGYSHMIKERLLSVFDGNAREVLWENLYDKDFYTRMYEDRNQQIKKYFSNAPHKLLTIDVTQEERTEKICEFLNIPTDFAINMPHANKT